MDPVDALLEFNEHCDWDFLPSLPSVAKTSSKFEDTIEIKKDKCDNFVLMMGGYVQCHEADEYIYHEMFIHPAMVAFAAMNGHAPKRVFVGGGGDGATPRELLRWRSISEIVMVDIDKTVTDFTQKYIPSFANGSMQNPRLNWIVGDALQYLKDLPKEEVFDVLVLDFPDPFEGVGLEFLYSAKFYELVKTHMHETSLLVTQSGPCVVRPSRAGCEMAEDTALQSLAKVFSHVDLLHHPMATWKPYKETPSEWSSVSYAALSLGSLQDKEKSDRHISVISSASDVAEHWLAQEVGTKLKYYNAARHAAATQRPIKFIERLKKRISKARSAASKMEL
jgi:spermidine synthase